MDKKRERTAAGTRGSYLGEWPRLQSVDSCGDTQTKVCATFMHVPPRPHKSQRRLLSAAIALTIIVAPLTIHSQSGRQKDPKTANANKSAPIFDDANCRSFEPEFGRRR